jgi:phenylalanyl-tRNA synthetase alpha chain
LYNGINLPEYHPARDMQDTFFIKKSDILLRTHTSSGAIWKTINHQYEQFLQEGFFVVGISVTLFFTQVERILTRMFLCQTNLIFTKEMFGICVLLIFTEPSAEIDIIY